MSHTRTLDASANPENHLSPLFLACHRNDIHTIVTLLSNNENPAYITPENATALTYVRSVEAAKLIITAAEKAGSLQTLLSAGPCFGYNFFEIACRSLNPEIALFYCQLSSVNITDFIDLRSALNMARNMAWQHPKMCRTYDAICSLLNEKKLNQYPYCAPPQNKSRSFFLDNEAFSLFRTNYKDLATTEGREAKIKSVLVQFSALLRNPLACTNYFRFLNAEFKRYCKDTFKNESNFSLNIHSYDFIRMNGVKFPIPNSNYVKNSKRSALQSFLVSLFQQHGLADNCYKWTGFIPEDITNKMIANGDFFKEDRFEIGLFHGTLSHMFQQVILIYALQSNEISLDYVENNEKHWLSIKDILQAFVQRDLLAIPEDLPWVEIRDSRRMDIISFIDPFRINEFIMIYGDQNGFGELAHHVIDTFCKGYLKLLDAMNQAHPENQMDALTFAEKLNDRSLEEFSCFALTLQHSIERDKNKGRTFFVSSSNDSLFAVVNKKYVTNPNFSHKRFSW